MSENSNPNNQEEKESKQLEDNKNKINYSFSPANNSFKKKNNQLSQLAEKEKSIKIKKSLIKGKILGGQFIIGEEIGKGTFGVVRIATHIITGEKVAVKMLFKNKILEESQKKRVEREIKILKILRHKNIVQLYNVLNTSSTIYLVMEHIKGKELFEIIVRKKRLSEIECLKYYQQLISGIEYLGKIRVAHRDLKPENLLIDSNDNLKIADFGLSNIYKHNELLSTACGSPSYAAPEMLSGEKYYGLSADIWSSGIILYTMLCGRLPFEDKNNEILYKIIKEGIFKIPEFLSENAKDILQKILVVDPKKRYSISEIKNHPWFNQLDQRKYMSKGLLLNKYIVPIDEDIVNKMENEYEYNSKEVRLNLLGNKHNHITTTYYLLLKKRIKDGINSICDMASNDFLNYINNSKNLISSYNGDWNTIFKERGIKNIIEKSSTFKSNNSKKRDSKPEMKKNTNDKKEINVNDKIKKENIIIFNNKDEDFLTGKNQEKYKENKNEDDIKNENANEINMQLPFENKNNGFKEKIDEIYKQKKQNNNNVDENIINNMKDKKIEKFQKINNNNKNIKNKNNKNKPIKLEKINKINYTPSASKDREQNSNNNIHINTISFSNNSNQKNITSYQTKSSNSKNEGNNYKNKSNNKFKISNNKNTKSAGKYNKIRKKAILININKILIENKKVKKKEKNERIKTVPVSMGTFPTCTKKSNVQKSKTINKSSKNLNKNNSSKFISYKNDKTKKYININLINKNNHLNTKNNSTFKSENKIKKKIDINKNKNYRLKRNIYNKFKFTPSFTISNNKITYNQNTNFSKQISIEGIYYAHKKNLQEINNLYNKISFQSKYKKSDSTIKKFL